MKLDPVKQTEPRNFRVSNPNLPISCPPLPTSHPPSYCPVLFSARTQVNSSTTCHNCRTRRTSIHWTPTLFLLLPSAMPTYDFVDRDRSGHMSRYFVVFGVCARACVCDIILINNRLRQFIISYQHNRRPFTRTSSPLCPYMLVHSS